MAEVMTLPCGCCVYGSGSVVPCPEHEAKGLVRVDCASCAALRAKLERAEDLIVLERASLAQRINDDEQLRVSVELRRFIGSDDSHERLALARRRVLGTKGGLTWE